MTLQYEGVPYSIKRKKYLSFIVEMYLKKVILLIHIVTGDHSDSIAIMTDVSADPVHGKVVLSNIYHPLKFTKMLIDITDILSSLIRVILPIPVIDAA